MRGVFPTIGWWEARRLHYNLIVGAAGLISAAVIFATALTCERMGGVPLGLPDPPFLAVLAVIAFGIVANVCYTGGWIVELLVAKVWHVESTRFGPIAFALGTAFSALVALIPAALNLVVAALTLCRGLT